MSENYCGTCQNCRHGEEVSEGSDSQLMVCDIGPEVVTRLTACEEWEAKDGKPFKNDLVRR